MHSTLKINTRNALNILLLLTSATIPLIAAHPSLESSPFEPPLYDISTLDFSPNTTANSNQTPPTDLIRRDGNCPVNANSCTTLVAAAVGACCAATAVCSLDSVGILACCPRGSYCTGTIGVPATTSAVTVTGTNTIIATTTGTVTYVSNVYFPFPIISATYDNNAACVSATAACSSNYALCTARLQGGGGYGVTVVAPGGGGITVGGATGTLNLGVASATSICSSLSSAGCGVLNCATVTGTAGAVVTGFTGVTTGSGAGGMGEKISGWKWTGMVGMVGAMLL